MLAVVTGAVLAVVTGAVLAAAMLAPPTPTHIAMTMAAAVRERRSVMSGPCKAVRTISTYSEVVSDYAHLAPEDYAPADGAVLRTCTRNGP